MVTRSKIRAARDAMLGAGLTMAALVAPAFATPVLTNPGEEPAISRHNDEQPAETRPALMQPRPLSLPSEFAETRSEERAFARDFMPERSVRAAPASRSAPASEVDLQFKQMFRQLGRVFAEPAGAPVAERNRSDGALDFGRGEVHFLGFGGAMVRDPLANATQAGAASFPTGGYDDFTFGSSGGRRSHNTDVPQPVYASSYSPSSAQSEYSSARAVAASSKWQPLPAGASSAEHLAPFLDSFSDVATDPVTIMVGLGWLLLWLLLETVPWSPARRRRRR
jgi:hypothetical protein